MLGALITFNPLPTNAAPHEVLANVRKNHGKLAAEVERCAP
jgi:hypothetical protein